MSIVGDLDKLKDWAAREICTKVQLKLPDDDANDASYPGQLVTPEAFVMYVPTKDRLPPRVAAPIPSLCVQLVTGKHEPAHSSGRFQVRFCLSAWNPGEHGGDIYKPTRQPSGSVSYRQWTGPEARTHFVSTEFIDGLRIIKEDGLEYGPFTDELGIVDYYPYWFAWISCSFEHALPRRTPKAYEDFL